MTPPRYNLSLENRAEDGMSSVFQTYENCEAGRTYSFEPKVTVLA